MTSQARTKRGNRRSEHLLREAELWATTAVVRAGAEDPRAALENAWRTVLLHQFHDILPGSSITWVHQEAEREYARIAGVLEGVIEVSVRALCGPGEGAVVLNAGPYGQSGVPALGGLALRADSLLGARIAPTLDGWVLTNRHVRVTIDPDGVFSSIYDRHANREVVPIGARANLLTLHRDTPTQGDAWDLDTPARPNVRGSH
ncbi:glycoside hydrolase family 38 C-terminal domain-containing protein [Cryobacterium sp. TMT1-3]|uniref:glycoside hydrolase family 38 C-terminal domain-containing protein n=1 Tax=Cryobacterium sp. TMT1-3 TaxID=1259237 RepID=UPI001F5448FB|nr:glycoside hydrolase family 38 C-terminal domain-containing protein [Cryobacterium sp. TMT1-3]